MDVSGEDLVAAEGERMTPLPIDSPVWALGFLMASLAWDWMLWVLAAAVLR